MSSTAKNTWDQLTGVGDTMAPSLPRSSIVVGLGTTTMISNRAPKNQHQKLLHYRVILEHIDHNIRSFRNARELVTVIRDAFIAFDDAFQIAHILHRDISIANITIKEMNGRTTGVLLDWDVCKDLTRPSSSNRHIERIGTWEFMSGSLVAGATVHTREDGVESFYYILNYVASLFLQHPEKIESLVPSIYNIFISRLRRSNGFPLPSRSKLYFVAGGSLAVTPSNPRILSILEATSQVFGARYAEIKVTAEDDEEDIRGARNLIEKRRQMLQKHRWLSDYLTTELNGSGWNEAADPVDREADF
ncbi:hypothetical protein BDN72DRAFT_964324 [Pluteus cervinus]|uniref:Uncharacterized protein n=1 Tax=Pluteus cervinus TaxID=181527 RepID=A0ACD3AAK2_9AGAR|nr:hypothetical protein BDN72DRAFT_964324 [Pluteus cervinus]